MNRNKLQFFLAGLLAAGCLSWGLADTKSVSKPATVFVNDPPTLVVDDWDDGVPPNNLSGGGGIFTDGGSGTATETFVSVGALGGTGYSLKINYNVSAGGSYAGYWTKFHPTSTKNLSNYKYLSFYVKGAVGGEFFKVELSTSSSGWKSRVYITDYLDGGITTQWKKVVIPFDNFANIVDWTKIVEFTIVFEQWAVVLNGSPTSGTIYIDNLVVGSDTQGVVRLDHFGDKLGVNSLGGETGTAGNGIGSYSYSADQYKTSPYSLEINYDVSTSYAYVAIYEIVGGTTTGWGKYPHNFSYYDQISFWIKANSDTENPEKVKIELKEDVSSYPYFYLISGVTTIWKQYTIPFSSFKDTFERVLNPSAIVEWVYTVDWSNSVDKTGKVYIDNVQFEKSDFIPDLTAPAIPTNLKIMDTAAGRPVTDGTNFQWLNWLTCYAENGVQDPTLEGVCFEYRATGSPTWTTIGFDYDVSDNLYQAYWDTTGLAEAPQTYELQAIARDTAGNESLPLGYGNLTITHYPVISAIDEELLDLIQKQIFWYYWTEINPDKGLIQDRARNFTQDTYGYTSVASAGMGLIAICIAHQRGWLNFTDAYNRVTSILKAYFNAPDPPVSDHLNSPILLQHKGFFYHYTNFGGARAGGELSTIDTTLFLAGALFAGKYFKNFGYNTPWDFADQMYRRVDWNWMRNDSDYLQWGWTPEYGFNQGTIGGYSEGILAYILGIGSPEATKQLPNANGWNNLSRPIEDYRDLSYVFEKALFTHQYAGLFVDFGSKKDSFACYAGNTFKATIHHHRYAYDNRSIYSTYNENSWGLGGTDDLHGGYTHYGVGTPGVDNEGTIVLNNLLTAITERPRQVLQAIRYLYANFGAKLWGKYTLSDSYNTALSQSAYFNETGMWRDPDILGVQQGAALLAIENYRSGLIKDTFTNISYIQDSFNRLSFTSDNIPPGPITTLSANMANGDVALSWIAPGDDNYSGSISDGIYEIRFSTNSLDTWDTAPDNYLAYNIIWSTNTAAGQNQSRIIPALPGNTTYYFWIKTADDSYNWSPVSDQLTFYVTDNIAPAAINSLVATTGVLGGEINLTWATPGDDGINGVLQPGSEYRIQYSSSAPVWLPSNAQIIISTAAVNPGVIVGKVVVGLIQGQNYSFRIWTADEVGNWSVISNAANAAAKVLDLTPPAAIANLSALTGAADGEIKLSWGTPGDDEMTGTLPSGSKYRIQYSSDIVTVVWSTSTYNVEISTSGIAQSTIVGTAVAGLIPGTTYYFRIWTADEAGNWSSGLSNGATAQARNWGAVWDDCDSRVYQNEGWGNAPSISWVTYDTRKCVKADFGAGGAGRWGAMNVYDRFLPEDWSSATNFKADVYVNTGGTNIKLETVRNNGDGAVSQGQIGLSASTWNTVSWPLSGTRTDISRIHIIFGNVPAAATIFYVDNLRLVKAVEEEWDDLDDASNSWFYGGDAYLWTIPPVYSRKREPITHNQSSSPSPAASLFLQWDAAQSGDVIAKVTSGGDLSANWSSYKSIKIWVRCFSTTNNIKVGFKDGINSITTAGKTVSLVDTWQEMSWNLPSGAFVWNSVNSLEFIVETNSGAGTIYIDNIQFSEQAAE